MLKLLGNGLVIVIPLLSFSGIPLASKYNTSIPVCVPKISFSSVVVSNTEIPSVSFGRSSHNGVTITGNAMGESSTMNSNVVVSLHAPSGSLVILLVEVIFWRLRNQVDSKS